MTADVGIWVAIGALAVTVGGLLVRYGRVLERQKVHSELLDQHRGELDELAHGHGETRAAFEGLKGEIAGLKGVMEALGDTLREWIQRLDRHLEK